VWLTGLPSSGKSTLAAAFAAELAERGREVEVLDGDEVRRVLSPELGFSRKDREANVARIGYVAELLARHGTLVVVAAIAPYAQGRALVRARHDASGTSFYEVYVSTPLEVCARRDVKGLYALQRAGKIQGLTGVDDPYEAPTRPELGIDTDATDVRRAMSLLHGLVGTGLSPTPVSVSPREGGTDVNGRR
jgi:adenylylsulfate kinase